MKNILYMILGIILGVTGCVIFYFFYFEREYFELQNDYKIEGQGILKKGTVIQYDQSYPEGFTRFILYLNLKDSIKSHKTERKNVIIPYWLDRIEE